MLSLSLADTSQLAFPKAFPIKLLMSPPNKLPPPRKVPLVNGCPSTCLWSRPSEPTACTNQLTRCLVHHCVFPTLMREPMPCQGVHGLGLLLAPTVKSISIATSHDIVPMVVPSQCTRHCAPVPCIVLIGLSQLHVQCPSDHDIALMASHLACCTRLRCPRAYARRRQIASGPVLLRSQGAHHTCRGAHVCLLECRSCVLGMPKEVPWCPLGAVKAFPWCLLESPTTSLKEQYKLFSRCLEETSYMLEET